MSGRHRTEVTASLHTLAGALTLLLLVGYSTNINWFTV